LLTAMPDTLHSPIFSVSANAAKRIAALKAEEGDDALLMRVTVSGGGCSGFKYDFTLDRAVNDDDRVFERDGVKVVVDTTSLEFLANAELDFKEDLMGSYFAVGNPNATSSCGCGASFSVD
jgi:iron-sulfur cluster insertion protein